MSSLYCRLQNFSKQIPDKIALICNQRTITYGELYKISTCIAKHLARQCLPGSVVALHLPNSLELVYAYLGCFVAGLFAVPLSIKLKAPQINYILEQAHPVYFMTHYKYLAELEDVNFHNEDALQLFIVNGNHFHAFKWNKIAYSFNELYLHADGSSTVEGPSFPQQSSRMAKLEPTHEAAVFFTSGSTGRPKGVVHTHSSLLAMAESIAYCADLTQEDRFYVCAPATGASGFSHVMSALCKGATAILADEVKDLSHFVKDLHYYQPTILSGMGKANFEIINDPFITMHDFKSVKVNLTGGDKISKSLIKQFKAKTNVHLRQSYGMTEVICITVNKSLHPNKFGSIGTATKDVTIRLMDKNLQSVPVGQVGEVFVSGPNVMRKYWRDESLTHKTIVNGMLRTGDLAYRDEEGYYWFFGRLKQLIIRVGNNISPFEIEEVLLQHNAVKLAAAVGKPDTAEGEVPVAFVILKNKNVTPAELIAFASKRLEDFKIPTAIYIVKHLPLTQSNKIARSRLKELIPKP